MEFFITLPFAVKFIRDLLPKFLLGLLIYPDNWYEFSLKSTLIRSLESNLYNWLNIVILLLSPLVWYFFFPSTISSNEIFGYEIETLWINWPILPVSDLVLDKYFSLAGIFLNISFTIISVP